MWCYAIQSTRFVNSKIFIKPIYKFRYRWINALNFKIQQIFNCICFFSNSHQLRVFNILSFFHLQKSVIACMLMLNKTT